MFRTTQWSVVLASRSGDLHSRAALEALCSAYREPVLAFIRRQPRFRDQAEDLTQAFFLDFLAARTHAAADPLRGRFRNFLLGALKHFLSHAAAHAGAARRGGGVQMQSLDAPGAVEPPDGDDPELAFERAWAMTVLRRAFAKLHAEAVAAGKERLYAAAAEFVLEPPEPARYAEVAALLGMRRNTFAVAVHRMRERLRTLVRAELAETVANAAELDDEQMVLRRALHASPAHAPAHAPPPSR